MRGAGGFAAAAASALDVHVAVDGVLDPAALVAVTRLASAAAHAADRDARAPALPQRAGLTSGAMEPVAPLTARCAGWPAFLAVDVLEP